MAASKSTTTSSIMMVMLLFFISSIGCSWYSSSTITITIVNEWSSKVWPVMASRNGTSPLPFTGLLALQPGESTVVAVAPNWSGRIWGRTLCSYDLTSGRFACVTGDCAVECRTANPPVTIAEFSLNGTGEGFDFFRVSLVYGYNLPITVEPLGGRSSDCSIAAGCAADLNMACPARLKVVTSGGEVVGCQSACQAFGGPQFCSKPNLYSQFFKSACPYAYTTTDEDATFSCASSLAYLITFNAAAAATSTTTSSKQSEDGKYPTGATSKSSTGNEILLSIVKVVLGLFATLIGCYAAYKIRLCFPKKAHAVPSIQMNNVHLEPSVEVPVAEIESGA